MLKISLFFFTFSFFYSSANCHVVRLVDTQADDNVMANFVAQQMLKSEQFDVQLIRAHSTKEAYDLLSDNRADAYLNTWVSLDKKILKPYLLIGKIKTHGKILSNITIGIAGNAAALDQGILTLNQLNEFSEPLKSTIYIAEKDWYVSQSLEYTINNNIYHLSEFKVKKVKNDALMDIMLLAEKENKPVVFFTRELSRLGSRFAEHFLYDNHNELNEFQGQTDIYSTVSKAFPKTCAEPARLLKELILDFSDSHQFFSAESSPAQRLNTIIHENNYGK